MAVPGFSVQHRSNFHIKSIFSEAGTGIQHDWAVA